jgi:hypothetical protein
MRKTQCPQPSKRFQERDFEILGMVLYRLADDNAQNAISNQPLLMLNTTGSFVVRQICVIFGCLCLKLG